MTRMTREEAAEILDGRNIVPMPVYLKALEAAANALCESAALRADAPPPNDPLTLEELREMDGEPVWDSILSVYGFVNVRSFNGKGCIRYVDNWTNPRCLVPGRYYRRRPEEGTI